MSAMGIDQGLVLALACDDTHRFSKRIAGVIDLLAGLGVRRDVHEGVTVRHRSRVAADPTQPNLRQVHLIHSELFNELRTKGFDIGPSDLGENITTTGIDLLGLPRGTLLHIGDAAVLEVTGLRNPCAQIERFRTGLLAAVLDRAPDGSLIRKAGIMAIVRTGGRLHPGDTIRIERPPQPHLPLERV